MKICLLQLLIVFFLGVSNSVFAQEPLAFEFSGRVKDKDNKYTLNTTTVSLFDADSTLVSFQITNTYGIFNFKVAEIKYPCQLRISNLGYFLKIIDIKTAPKIPVDLGDIELESKSRSIEEVEIKLAPVTLNGDTLEFNPAAFKLDENAVLDDLLKKIPNVTIWNDGQITVNGREIKSLMVNGKPFFGTDFKVITGNLPKNIIQKIQVYRKEETLTNPLDSIMEMNIQLKKGMDKGFFGKISGGLGTGENYEAEGNINYFTKKLQLSLAGTSNSTNKIANDIQTLLKNSTFKSTISDIEYQSNFRLPGINNVDNGGAQFSYDFLETRAPGYRSDISGSYFTQRLHANERAETTSLRTLNMAKQNFEFDETSSLKKENSDNLALRYNLNNNISSLDVYAQESYVKKDELNSLSTFVRDEQQQILSSYQGQNEIEDVSTKYRFWAHFSYDPQKASSEVKRKGFLPFNFSYIGNSSHYKRSSIINTSFISAINPLDNVDFNRSRSSDRHINIQHLDLTIRNINRILFGKQAPPVDISLIGNYGVTQERNNDYVSDVVIFIPRTNDYLTNESSEVLRRVYYGLGISKHYARQLTDRFERSVSLSFKPRFMNISFATKSQKVVQQIKKSSTTFFPSADFSIYRYNYGKHRTNFSVNYSTEINLPNLQVFAPLVDSTKIYNLRMGNLNLNQENIHSVNLLFSREYPQKTNSLAYSLGAVIRFSSDKIADSILLSLDNRQRIFPVNSDGYQQHLINAVLKKSFKFKSSDLKLQLDASINRTNMPTYINSNFVINKQQSANLAASFGYGYKDFLVLELKENIIQFKSKQPFFSRDFEGITFVQTVNALIRVTKRININSNINFNINNSPGFPSTQFTIWNVYASCRFFKHQNAEFKISALDLLDQNKNIINIIGINSFGTTIRNSLQRYVLFSLAFYPKKFGK